MQHPLEPAALYHEIFVPGLFLAPAKCSRDHPRPCRSRFGQRANSAEFVLRPTAARGGEPVASA